MVLSFNLIRHYHAAQRAVRPLLDGISDETDAGVVR